MRASLIVATLGRTDALDRLLKSLENQTHKDLEVWFVDQNEDDRVARVIERFPNLEIHHLRSPKGLSRARNVALPQVTGEIVAFPDDDCWYPPTLLENVNKLLEQNPSLDGVTGLIEDEQGRQFGGGKFSTTPGKVEKLRVFHQGMSISIFLRKRLIDKVGLFDEKLGLGSGTPYGAGEETDYLLRALDQGFELRYDPSIVAGHERTATSFTPEDAKKARITGMGLGRVWRQHRFPITYVANECIRSLGGSIIYGIQGKANRSKFYLNSFSGKFNGWRTGSN
jgi:glycosyltransferase involved in cell wall biosynthesis